MKCPSCNYNKFSICHSYPVNDGVKRLRYCKRCKHYFNTLEVPLTETGLSALRGIIEAQDLEEAVSLAYRFLTLLEADEDDERKFPFSNHIKR